MEDGTHAPAITCHDLLKDIRDLETLNTPLACAKIAMVVAKVGKVAKVATASIASSTIQPLGCYSAYGCVTVALRDKIAIVHVTKSVHRRLTKGNRMAKLITLPARSPHY